MSKHAGAYPVTRWTLIVCVIWAATGAFLVSAAFNESAWVLFGQWAALAAIFVAVATVEERSVRRHARRC